jgi:hypothetical protein
MSPLFHLAVERRNFMSAFPKEDDVTVPPCGGKKKLFISAFSQGDVVTVPPGRRKEKLFQHYPNEVSSLFHLAVEMRNFILASPRRCRHCFS